MSIFISYMLTNIILNYNWTKDYIDNLINLPRILSEPRAGHIVMCSFLVAGTYIYTQPLISLAIVIVALVVEWYLND